MDFLRELGYYNLFIHISMILNNFFMYNLDYVANTAEILDI